MPREFDLTYTIRVHDEARLRAFVCDYIFDFTCLPSDPIGTLLDEMVTSQHPVLDAGVEVLGVRSHELPPLATANVVTETPGRED